MEPRRSPTLSDMSPHVRAAAGALAALLVAAGCSASPADPPRKPSSRTAAATPAASPAPPPSPSLPAVPGWAVGEIPPVPLVQLPDLAMLDAALAGFAIDLDRDLGDLPGVTVTPTRCDAAGEVQTGLGALWAYGDGSGVLTTPEGQVVTYGDGSGTYTLGGTTVTVYGDGSGTYDDGTRRVVSYGDGSGVYDDGTTAVYVHTDGGGGWTRGDRSIVNHGDGSGSYSDATTSIVNYGDGSGYYEGDGLVIRNWGDGTGLVDGVTVEMEPLPPVPRLGAWPSMGAVAPVVACGTTVTLDAALLFDFGSAELRPDAAASLDALATALAGLDVPSASVEGHTDAISSTEFNQRLSEDRARAVADGLAARGVDVPLDVVGWGEGRPVAPEVVDGRDDPAGRQLNRRVEILLPGAR